MGSRPMDQPYQDPSGDNRPEWKSAVFPCVYRLRVRGRIKDHARMWFRGMEVMVDETHTPPQTVIVGEILDLAQLYGLISRMRDLGMTLILVERTE